MVLQSYKAGPFKRNRIHRSRKLSQAKAHLMHHESWQPSPGVEAAHLPIDPCFTEGTSCSGRGREKSLSLRDSVFSSHVKESKTIQIEYAPKNTDIQAISNSLLVSSCLVFVEI